MSDMNYENKYKEIVGKIRKAYLYVQTDSTKAVLEDILPELAESEDERVRKELIRSFKSLNTIEIWNGIKRSDILAWLEKQGEKKPEENKGNIGEISPNWSEEDERNLQGVIDEIEANKNQAPDYDLATYDRFLSWLKSLRPQK